ncbi:MAG: hypothetical protein C5B49_04945 [Bdellovibrio sp.]|nr:MAG: hypothetical protein C5B49_04945 [Bdellovibrio sp.]
MIVAAKDHNFSADVIFVFRPVNVAKIRVGVKRLLASFVNTSICTILEQAVAEGSPSQKLKGSFDADWKKTFGLF